MKMSSEHIFKQTTLLSCLATIMLSSVLVASADNDAVTGKLKNVKVAVGATPRKSTISGPSQPLSVFFSGEYSLQSTDVRLAKPVYHITFLIETEDKGLRRISCGGPLYSDTYPAKNVMNGKWTSEEKTGMGRKEKLLLWKVVLLYKDKNENIIVLDAATNATEAKCKALGEKFEVWTSRARI